MIIKISLLLHQYHGNAWHHAHCEGLVDWPPAPWRILRSLVAGSYNTNFSQLQQTTLKQVLWKMAQVAPTYYLPPTAYLQWRSPRPQVQKNASVGPGKTLYSACLLVPENDSSIYCSYDIACSDQELIALKEAMQGVTYLGRRESPAVWEIVEAMPTVNAYPDSSGVRVVASPIAALSEVELWDYLNLSAADVFQKRKQAVFPGVEQTTYKLEPMLSDPHTNRVRILPNRVLLSVQGANKVAVSQAIYLCESLHRQLVKAHPEPIFTGMELGAKVISHDHAFITPISDRTGRWIDYLELYSHQGFSPSAVSAIANANRIRLNQWVSLAIADFSQSSERYTGWTSITPMFLSRYPVMRNGKPRLIPGTSYQKDCPEHQALKYLQFLSHLNLNGTASFEAFPNGLGMKVDKELTAICKCDVWMGAGKWLNGKHGKLSLEQGFRVWMEFTRPVEAPISLGYRCHYGFGALAPMREGAGVTRLIAQKADIARVMI